MIRNFLPTAWLACLVFVSAGIETVNAQEASPPAAAEELTVGLYIDPPFVMKKDGTYSGMAIDLWNILSANLDLRTAGYVELDTVAELVDATENGEIDVAVTNLTITRDRVERIDFTHSWFDAGLRIMISDRASAGFWNVIAGLKESGHLRAYGWIAFIIVVATFLVTLFDRHFDKAFPKRWPDGIAESFYTVMSVATSGKPPSRKNLFGWVGRIWQGVWLVCGIAVLAYVTSSVTSVMTTLSLTSQISSAADLPGRPVGVFTGSVSEQYARGSGIDAHTFANIDEAVEALVDGRIDAIIGDAPVLEYYAQTNAGQPVAVVGAIFEPDKYGFALPHRSDLTRELTVELIGARESGRIEEIRARYFGERP